MKIFISFSTDDRETAVSLYGDLSGAGAEVFRFGESETIGTPTWPEILRWISKSDVFILLVSESALRSQAVEEEVDHAHYCYINSSRKHPSKLVPAILEKGVGPPIVMKRFSHVDIWNYKSGCSKLCRQLGLSQKAAKFKATDIEFSGLYRSAIDLDKSIVNLRKTSPPPPEREKWTQDAVTLLSNYSKLKPVETTKKEEAAHLDKLLTDYSGKEPKLDPVPTLSFLDSAFLGIPSYQSSVENGPVKPAPELNKLLLNFDDSLYKLPLDAPDLKAIGTALMWNQIKGAIAYVVEESYSADFTAPKEVCRDSATMFIAGGTALRVFNLTRYYRVKATGGVFRTDSAWSNSVAVEPPKPMQPLLAPTLTVPKSTIGTNLTWNRITGAVGYLLEQSRDSSFEHPVKLYEGKDNTYTDLVTLRNPILSPLFWQKPDSEERKFEPILPTLGNVGNFSVTPTVYYRVKAQGGILQIDSPWSEIVSVSA